MYTPEVARYSAAIKHSFAYETALKRWPIILTQVVDGLYRKCHELMEQGLFDATQQAEAKDIIGNISKLKYEMTHDRALSPLGVTASNASRIGSFFVPSTEPYDDLIERTKPTWYKSDWLFTECYLYRRLRHLFERSAKWRDFDPFLELKNNAFRASGLGIYACAVWMHELLSQSQTHAASSHETQATFNDLIYSSLWGNATDLSLLLQVDKEELKKLQVDSEHERNRKLQHVLVNDVDAVWRNLRSVRHGRVDMVLDNAGFELVTDFMLAEFLLTLRGPIPSASEERANDIEGRIYRIQRRITETCQQQNLPKKPRLLVVSKLQPPSALMAAYDRTGQRHFGENYVQELIEKARVLPDDIQWHFIGGLQSNKAKLLAAVPNLYAVQSVDSEKLALGLEKTLAKPEHASLRKAPLYVYIQVNTSGEAGKSGVPAMDAPWDGISNNKPPLLSLAQTIMLTCPHMRFSGLMTIGALTNSQSVQGHEERENPDFLALVKSRKYLAQALEQDSEFQAKLSNTSFWAPQGNLQNVYGTLREHDLELSMGMSADMSSAIAMGSTCVRIGSDSFGARTTNSEAASVREAELDACTDVPLIKEVVFHTKNMPWFVSVRMRIIS